MARTRRRTSHPSLAALATSWPRQITGMARSGITRRAIRRGRKSATRARIPRGRAEILCCPSTGPSAATSRRPMGTCASPACWPLPAPVAPAAMEPSGAFSWMALRSGSKPSSTAVWVIRLPCRSTWARPLISQSIPARRTMISVTPRSSPRPFARRRTLRRWRTRLRTGPSPARRGPRAGNTAGMMSWLTPSLDIRRQISLPSRMPAGLTGALISGTARNGSGSMESRPLIASGNTPARPTSFPAAAQMHFSTGSSAAGRAKLQARS